MMTIRKSEERGQARFDWLDSKHTFSFGDYHDPQHMGFRSLRVINDDTIAPGGGFGTHPHRDMEIITVVFDGALAHKDSMGSAEVLRPGEVQRMSAGTGIQHSEYNHSSTEPVHLLQLWIVPDQKGATPRYEQKRFDDTQDRLRLVISRDGREGSLDIHQDADLYLARLSAGAKARHPIAASRHAWVQVASGQIELNGTRLNAGDGAALSGESALNILAKDASEVLVFDLA